MNDRQKRKRKRLRKIGKTALGVGIVGGVAGAIASQPSLVGRVSESAGSVPNFGSTMLDTATDVANAVSSGWLLPLGGIALLAYGYSRR